MYEDAFERIVKERMSDLTESLYQGLQAYREEMKQEAYKMVTEYEEIFDKIAAAIFGKDHPEYLIRSLPMSADRLYKKFVMERSVTDKLKQGLEDSFKARICLSERINSIVKDHSVLLYENRDLRDQIAKLRGYLYEVAGERNHFSEFKDWVEGVLEYLKITSTNNTSSDKSPEKS